ncbi:MAG: 2OG-Fe(II) oxygenase [Deltaproteobacteria bacterium]|nr:2OG-Fe(II) oxygenase [Deltaproteobacteria bacterium]
MREQWALHGGVDVPEVPGFCRVVDDFLTDAECAAWIAQAEAAGFGAASSDYPPSYRDNERLVQDDAATAKAWSARLAGVAPARLDADDGAWVLAGVNARIRTCRYLPGQQFRLHRDGVHHRGPDLRSRLTLLVYLDDGDAFGGGDTVFYAGGPATVPRELARVRPRRGRLLIFDHALWHAGAVVEHGVKRVVRSDVLYARDRDAGLTAPPAAETAPWTPGHQGYVWALARLHGEVVASGGRDTTIRLWRPDGRPLGTLVGHERSVLGLVPGGDGIVYSVSRDRTLRRWRWRDGVCEAARTLHDGAVLCLARGRDTAGAGLLATGGADGVVQVLRDPPAGARGVDATPRVVQTQQRHAGWVWDVAPLGEDAAEMGWVSVGEDGGVCIWDGRGPRARLTEPRPLRAVLPLPEREELLVGDVAGMIARWRKTAHGWTKVAVWAAHRASIRRLRSLGAGLFASTGEDRAVHVWSEHGGRPVASWCHDDFATDVLAAGARWLSAGYDGRIIDRAPWSSRREAA